MTGIGVIVGTTGKLWENHSIGRVFVIGTEPQKVAGHAVIANYHSRASSVGWAT